MKDIHAFYPDEATKQNQMTELMDRSYPFWAIFQKNGFHLYCPALGLKTESESVEKAFAQLESMKKEYFKDMLDVGLFSAVPLAQVGPNSMSAWQKNLSIFGIKLLLALSVFVLAMSLLLGQIDKFKDKLPQKMDRILNPSMASMEKRKVAFRKYAKALLPFMEEFEKLKQEQKKQAP